MSKYYFRFVFNLMLFTNYLDKFLQLRIANILNYAMFATSSGLNLDCCCLQCQLKNAKKLNLKTASFPTASGDTDSR